MDKGFGSWLQFQQSPSFNFLGGAVGTDYQNSVPADMYPYSNQLYMNGTFPFSAFSGLPQPKANQLNEPCNWFYCLPRFRQAFTPILNNSQKEKIASEVAGNCGTSGSPDISTGHAKKKFLVFDQSGDQTTLIYSSGIGGPGQYLNTWNLKPPGAVNLIKQELENGRDTISPFGPNSVYEFSGGNNGDEWGSEMHEDTEELNALLYSDNDSDYSDNEEDEVTSTGHSPSTMTANGLQELVEEGGEEVASSACPSKRQKLLNGVYNVPSPTDSADNWKHMTCLGLEDDAESSCGNDDNQVSRESGSLSGKKRSRKEKIRETISILQSIIPDGKGKDAVVVIDEAIHYLRSLKVKAKSLGLDSL